MVTFLFIQMVHRIWNYVAYATVVPTDTLISMKLLVSTFIFTAEINDATTSKFIIVYRLSFVSPGFIVYETGASFDWDGDSKSVSFTFSK